MVFASEAARMLSVSKQTIIAWEKSGRLPAVKAGNGVRLFSRRDVERLVNERSALRAGSAAA